MSQEQPVRKIEAENVSMKVEADDKVAVETVPAAIEAVALQSSGQLKKGRAPAATPKTFDNKERPDQFAQVVGQDGSHPVSAGEQLGGSTEPQAAAGCITIGEALEATALTAGHRPVDYSDAAAIQAAEVRATGRTNIVPGGVAAAAQSAATRNSRITRDEDKTKLGEILSDASAKLPSDKAVTRRDAEGVIGAELRNDPNLCTRPGGVAASIAAAARLNQSNSPTLNNSVKENKKQMDA